MRLVMFSLVIWILVPVAWADDKDEALAKQKAEAAENWKKMEFEKPSRPPVETANLIVYSRLPEAKTKALAASLEKIFTTATKALKYTQTERPWPGKATIYILPDRAEYLEFMRKVVKKSPSEGESIYSGVAGETAIVVVGESRRGGADPDEDAKTGLAMLLLQRKLGGAEPPAWLATGFARATASRAVKPTSKAASVARLSMADLWNNQIDLKLKTPSATYIVDYLAYGPGSELFADFVGALRPDENGQTPTLKEVAEAIKMDPVQLDYFVRTWRKLPKKPKDK